ncbi:MAG: hypothetical protein IJW38_00170 [Clostridia bacterium]|nr:hypothetical protein [Clostridia bacterium]
MTEFLSFSPPEIDKREILRYAAGGNGAEISALLDACIDKARSVLNYNVAFCELEFTIRGNKCDFGKFCVSSASLAKNLSKARRVFLFVASVGHGIDRLIAKFSRTSPLSALLFNAIGTERVEALADSFVAWLEKENCAKALSRFSAGYGDLPLALQKDVFEILKPERQMGVFLSDRFVMSPSKSVTAFVGLE